MTFRCGCLAGLLCAVLFLGGCINPRYRRPDVPVPPSYRGEHAEPDLSGGASNRQAGSLGELRWQELVRDETLSKLIQEALEHNFDVQIAAARVLEARAQLAASQSARFPSIDGQVSYNNSRATELDSSAAGIGASLNWEVDLWGRIRNASAAARANLLASEEARRTVLQTLVSDVATTYFVLGDLDMELQIVRRALELRASSRDLVQLRVDNGYSSEIDLRQADVLVKNARAGLAQLELIKEQTENQLSILLGRNPGPIARGPSLLDQELTAPLPAGLPSILLERRPDIRLAEQQLIGANALVAVAKAAYFPTLTLTSSGGVASSALSQLFTGTSSAWVFGPAADMPIFNAGRVRAAVRGAEARRQQAVLTYQKTVQQAFREVSDSLAARQRLAELRVEQEGLVGVLRQSVELSDLRYRSGIASYLEYIDSERQLLDAQRTLVQIRRQELANIVTLYRALGGGWQ